MKEKMRKKEEEEETLLMDNHACVNACQSSYNTLIRDERSNVGKETKQGKERWKDEVEAKQKHQSVQLKTLRINNDKVTEETNEKWKEVSKLNQRMVMLKEELTCVKDKLHKTDNVSNYHTDKREKLNKKETETL